MFSQKARYQILLNGGLNLDLIQAYARVKIGSLKNEKVMMNQKVQSSPLKSKLV